MKNTLLVLAISFFVATLSAQAQESITSSVSDFKPVAGDRTAEVGFNLQNGVFLNGGQLRFRKFTTDKNAFRLGANLYLDKNSPDDETSATYGVIGIAPGIERHFAGTNRLSPYIGAELPLAFAFSNHEDAYRAVSGAWGENRANRAFLGIGLNAVAGVDFYIAKSLFVGFEFGAGISYKKYNDIEIDIKEHDFSDRTIEGGSNISFNTFSIGGLRLGFVF